MSHTKGREAELVRYVSDEALTRLLNESALSVAHSRERFERAVKAGEPTDELLMLAAFVQHDEETATFWRKERNHRRYWQRVKGEPVLSYD